MAVGGEHDCDGTGGIATHSEIWHATLHAGGVLVLLSPGAQVDRRGAHETAGVLRVI